MSTKKKPAKAVNSEVNITNCTVTSNNNTAANEHTRAAVEALARASERHADAMIAIANALKGGNITTSGHGMCIGVPNLGG